MVRQGTGQHLCAHNSQSGSSRSVAAWNSAITGRAVSTAHRASPAPTWAGVSRRCLGPAVQPLWLAPEPGRPVAKGLEALQVGRRLDGKSHMRHEP
jgi:hypothetical protein